MKRIGKTITGSLFGGSLLTLTLVACGGGGGGPGGSNGAKTVPTGVATNTNSDGSSLKTEAVDAFSAAVSDFKKHEESRDWSDDLCASVAKEFLDAGKAQGGKFPAAHYNAGVTLMRCAKDNDAGAEFEIALQEQADLSSGQKDTVFHQVWVQKAIIKFHAGTPASISEAIDIISTKGFDPDGGKNVEAFVTLGMLYRERWNKDPKNPAVTKKQDFGTLTLEDDLARSQFWLQNALSINDSFMPAYNQLALFYLDRARSVGVKNAEKIKAFGTKKEKEEYANKKIKSDLQTLELGLLVSEEASRRDPNYSAIWNTQGLILLDMNRTGAATQAFKLATDKDPKFFEAWMNYAAINLAFRGYGEAQKGYEAASAINSKSYDASLGKAVALRGQLDFHLTAAQAMKRRLNECKDPDKAATPGCQEAAKSMPAEMAKHESDFKDFFNKAGAAYDACKALDANRPEAFFDGALLVEKYKDKATGNDNPAVTYREAAKLFDEVSSKFAGVPAYKDLVDKSKVRSQSDIKAAEAFEKPATPPPAAKPATPPATTPATPPATKP